jgi:hypothetical protein
MSSSSQYYFLQTELENEVNDKRRIMEEANSALELQTRLEEENDSIRVAHEKTQKDLSEALKKMTLMERQLQKDATNTNYSEQIEHLQKENCLLEEKYEKLEESYKQVEQECMRLMDELLAFEKTESEKTDDKKDERMLRREIEQLYSLVEREKKRYNELEHGKKLKMERLNKELSDLESLIENKVFHESELETELENEKTKVLQLESRLRDELERNNTNNLSRKLSVPISPTSPKTYPFLFRQKRSSTTSTLVTSNSYDTSSDNDTQVENSYCEICESYGHEVISCTAIGNVLQHGDCIIKEDMDYSSCVSLFDEKKKKKKPSFYQ